MVAQVNEDQLSQVALALHPAAHGNGLARIGGTQVPAVMTAVETLKIVHENQLQLVVFKKNILK